VRRVTVELSMKEEEGNGLTLPSGSELKKRLVGRVNGW